MRRPARLITLSIDTSLIFVLAISQVVLRGFLAGGVFTQPDTLQLYGDIPSSSRHVVKSEHKGVGRMYLKLIQAGFRLHG